MPANAIPPDARPIPDFDDTTKVIPGYAAREDGTILWWYARGRRWVACKPKTGPYGHRKVWMRINGRVREIGVALLVLRAWVGPRPIGCEAFHYPDVSPGNCRLDNLRWAPRGSSKVGKTCSKAPTPRYGTDHPHARLTPRKVQEIRRLYRDGWPYKEIASALRISEEATRLVLIGKTWGHVPDPDGPIVMRRRGPEKGGGINARLDWDTAREIRAEYAAGAGSYKTLADRHGVDKCTIRDIITGRTWRETTEAEGSDRS